MLKVLSVISSLTTALLCGCATIDASNLRPGKSSASFELPAPLYAARPKQGSFGVKADYGLASGKYVAEHENDVGIFFRGPGRAVFFLFHAEPPHGYAGEKSPFMYLHEGGLWVPKVDGSPRLYYYFDPDAHNKRMKVDGAKTAEAMVPSQAPWFVPGVEPWHLAASQTGVVAGASGNAIGLALVGAMIEAGRGDIQTVAFPEEDAAAANAFKVLAARLRQEYNQVAP